MPWMFTKLVAIQTYDIATLERGWSQARLERWWRETLVGQLLAEGIEPTPVHELAGPRTLI